MITHQNVITVGDGIVGESFFFFWESLCFHYFSLLSKKFFTFTPSLCFGENYLTILSLVLYLRMKIIIVSTSKSCGIRLNRMK